MYSALFVNHFLKARKNKKNKIPKLKLKEKKMAIRNWKDIPLFKDVTDEQWNDWHWQVEHRLSTVEEIAQVVNLTEKILKKSWAASE